MAASRLAMIPRGPTFQPTDVLHEAFVRVLGSRSRAGESPTGDRRLSDDATWASDDASKAVATLAVAIRSVLVDRVRRRVVHAKHKQAMAKHGQGHDAFDAESGKWNLLAMDEALNALEQIEPRAARIVELRYFAGLSMEHAAALMGSALSTAERDWRFARAWLAERLGAVRE